MDPRKNEDESLTSAKLPANSEDARRTEELLRQFAPPALDLDRDRLMFLAGQAAANVERPAPRPAAAWLWPLSTVAMSGVAACLAIVLGIQMARPPSERIVYRDPPAPTPVVRLEVAVPTTSATVALTRPAAAPLLPSLPAGSVLQMRNVALRWGVDALPHGTATAAASAAQPTSADLWQELRDAGPKPNPQPSL